MKTKLFTQNSCFALLMVLVLALGMQGSAEAVTATAPADLVDITARQFETDIGSTAGATDGITISAITLEDVAVPEGGTADDTNTGADRSNSIETITVSTSGIQLTSPTFATSVTFSESTTTETQTATHRPMPSSVTLTGYFTRVGKATLTIRYTDLSDRQANSGNQASPAQTSAKTITHTYTYYVVNSDDAIRETTTLTLTRDGTPLSNGYITGLNGRTDFRIYNNNSGNYPVTYSVVPSPAALYFSDTPYATSDPAATATVSSSSGRKAWLNMNGVDTFGNGVTSIVTVNIGETSASPKSSFNVAYIIGTPKLDISLGPVTGVAEVDNDEKNRYRFTGGTQGQNAGTITATVGDGGAALNTDGNGFSTGAVPAGVLVKFELRYKGSTTGSLSVDANTFTQVDAKNNSRAGASLLDTDQTLYVRTNSSGAATVNYWFGTLGSQEIAVSSVGLSKKVTAEIGTSQTGPQISEDTNNQQSGNPQKFDLVALVEDSDGEGIANEVVTFRTNNGELEPISARPSSLATPGTDITLQGIVNVITSSSGKAHVVYDIGDNTGRQEIHASLSDGKSYTFVINGGAASGGGGGGSAVQQGPRLRITATGTGTTREVTVDALTAAGTLAPPRLVTLSGTAVTASQTVTTGTAETITVPSTPGIYRLTATDIGGIYASVTVVITVAAPSAPGTLSLQAIGVPAGNLQQTVEVTATNADGESVEGVSVTLRGTGFQTQTVTTLATGSVRAIVTIPSATGTHTLTAEATGYDPARIDLPATGQQPPGGPSQPSTQGPAGVADSIEIDGDRQLSATVNQALRLRARVLDANDTGVSGVRVTFKILRPGGEGRLSQRGNGLASQDETDRSGYASATLTPSGGDLIVQAKAAGITAPVSFIITVNGASDTGTDTGTGEPLEDATTPEDTTTPEPEAPLSMAVSLKVNASNRPVIYWIAGGALYQQATGDATQIAASATDVVVDTAGGKLYYIEQTSERSGALHTANLDGTNDEVLQTLTSVPQGLALDSVNKKLYLTNGWGKIQRMNVDGTGFETNFVTGLTGPMDIAVSSGRVYWTDTGGNVRFVNLSDPKDIRTIASDSGALGGIAADGRQVYWTEQTGARSGRIRASNLIGTGTLTDLFTFGAVPMGLGIDASTGKLYWTNGWGKVQRERDRSKGSYEDVATGLMTSPVIAIGGANSEMAEETPKSSTPTTADRSKYDVNGDGSVDSTDTGLIVLAISTADTSAKYDVNGDGKVDFSDYLLVSENVDAGAAGAPSVFGIKMTAVQLERLQEQIDLLIASGDRSPTAMRALIYFQQLIATARPDQTQLLANYPNPFNPETWIPYALATDTDVRITIYNAQGVVVRTLQLGQQSAGYYTDRERAAYWDGRNAFGEQVASGVYFFQLETDEMSALRKMVILK